MPEPVEGHPGWETTNIEVAHEEGIMILGYTLQFKFMTADGRVGMSTRQSELHDAEALGQTRTHMLMLERDLLGLAVDPREQEGT